LKMPPLRISTTEQTSSLTTNNNSDGGTATTTTTASEKLIRLRRKLILANTQVRRVKATVSITDLTHNKTTKNGSDSRSRQQPLRQLYDSKDYNDEAFTAMERLEEASSTALHALAQLPSQNGGALMIPRVHSLLDGRSKGNNRTILGRVRFSCSGTKDNETKEEKDGGG